MNSETLPALCYALIACHPDGQRIVAIRHGESGFYKTTLDHAGQSLGACRKIVDLYNSKLGVCEAAKLAMLHGSMFGFDTPGATIAAQQRVLQAGKEAQS